MTPRVGVEDSHASAWPLELDDMAWCRCNSVVVKSDHKQGLHWFVCGMDCRVRLDPLIIWVWEPLSSIDLICRFLVELKRYGGDDTLLDCPMGVADTIALRYEGFTHVMTIRLLGPQVRLISGCTRTIHKWTFYFQGFSQVHSMTL